MCFGFAVHTNHVWWLHPIYAHRYRTLRVIAERPGLAVTQVLRAMDDPSISRLQAQLGAAGDSRRAARALLALHFRGLALCEVEDC